jgi:predicted dehydrogenase
MRFLVVGCGSIGERHIRNLRALGAKTVIACDTSAERIKSIAEKYAIGETYTDPDRAIESGADAIVICTPPSSHIPLSLKAADRGMNIFVEKPFSDSTDGIAELTDACAKKNLVLQVGYCFRFQEGLRAVKDAIEKGALGKVLYARADYGQYLPSWRPWQNYKESYTAKKSLGGGIILDGSHEIDYILWLMGDATEVFSYAEKISSLEVETEDYAAILLRFGNGSYAEIHLDFVRHDYSRTCEIVGEKGTIKWSFQDRCVRTFLKETGQWETLASSTDTNEMYLEEMRHFIDCAENKNKPLVDGAEGERTLRTSLSAKRSAEEKKTIRI